MAKTNKSITKRIKLTKRGKMVRRGFGLNHFKARKSGHKQMGQRRAKKVNEIQQEIIRGYLYH